MHDMSSPTEKRSPAARYNSRVGIVLFVIYLVVYAVYVAISAFEPQVMKRDVFAGVNLAIVYGVALIVLAFALAMLYMALCKPEKEGGHL